MAEESFEERRRARRYPVRLAVTVFASGLAGPGVRGHTVDVSALGMRLVTEQDLVRGVDQTVMLDAPGEPIVAKALLVWTEARGERWAHGLMLRGLGASDAARLARLLSERV